MKLNTKALILLFAPNIANACCGLPGIDLGWFGDALLILVVGFYIAPFIVGIFLIYKFIILLKQNKVIRDRFIKVIKYISVGLFVALFNFASYLLWIGECDHSHLINYDFLERFYFDVAISLLAYTLSSIFFFSISHFNNRSFSYILTILLASIFVILWRMYLVSITNDMYYMPSCRDVFMYTTSLTPILLLITCSTIATKRAIHNKSKQQDK